MYFSENLRKRITLLGCLRNAKRRDYRIREINMNDYRRCSQSYANEVCMRSSRNRSRNCGRDLELILGGSLRRGYRGYSKPITNTSKRILP